MRCREYRQCRRGRRERMAPLGKPSLTLLQFWHSQAFQLRYRHFWHSGSPGLYPGAVGPLRIPPDGPGSLLSHSFPTSGTKYHDGISLA